MMEAAQVTDAKKRKRTQADDDADDATAARLEAELASLQHDNRQLVDCFVTLGEQMQSMLSENKHMRNLLTILNKGLNRGYGNAPPPSPWGAASDVSSPEGPSSMSPTVQMLAQFAFLSQALQET